MFEFKDQDPEKDFNLKVNYFSLSSMMFYNCDIFTLPSRNTRAEMDNILLNKVILKKSYFLRDTSTGFSNGRQWVYI